VTAKLYKSCVHTLHGSETWPVKKENELTLQQAEMRMIRWMCGIKVTDRIMCSELRETSNRRYDYSGTVNGLRWYGVF